MKKLVTTTLLFICASFAFSQNYVDLAKFHYANTPVNQFDSATNGSRVQELGLDFLLPVKLENNNALLFGGYVEQISTTLSPANPSISSVYTTLLKVGASWNHGEKWKGTYMLLPKLSSDFNGFNSKDFQLGALVLMKYKKSADLSYQFGMYYNGELFGPFFVPIVGAYYLSPSKKFEMNLRLPISADINYRFKPWGQAGAEFSAFVRTFHLHQPFKGEPNNYLAKTTNEIYGYLQFTIAKSFLLKTMVGYSIGRNYRIYDVEDRVTWGFSAFRFGDDRDQLNTDFQDGMILKARFIYRFNLD